MTTSANLIVVNTTGLRRIQLIMSLGLCLEDQYKGALFFSTIATF